MSKRSNLLSPSEQETLEIRDFIYHIVDAKNDVPEYLSQINLSGQSQRDFFKKLIVDTAKGTQFVFSAPDDNKVKNYCDGILADPSGSFVKFSRDIVRDFHEHHSGTTTSGIVIVARVTIGHQPNQHNMIAVIKVDYTPVLNQKRDSADPTIVSFEELIETLAETEVSVQKKALIDVGNKFEWDVVAVERNKGGKNYDSDKALTDFFKKFLSVRLRLNNSTYTRLVISAVNDWAKQYDGDMESTPSDLKAKTVNLLEAYDDQPFSLDTLKEVVCKHNSAAEAQSLAADFDDYMAEKGLSGVSFTPRKNSIQPADRKTTLSTDDDVKVIFSGSAEDNNIEIEKMTDGTTKITITTTGYKES
jgi:hypothetical protein